MKKFIVMILLFAIISLILFKTCTNSAENHIINDYKVELESHPTHVYSGIYTVIY